MNRGAPGTGIIRPFLIDYDTRGPDSVECSPLHDEHTRGECFGDYENLSPRFGFWCGCSCHDDDEQQAYDEAAERVTQCGRAGHEYDPEAAELLECLADVGLTIAERKRSSS